MEHHEHKDHHKHKRHEHAPGMSHGSARVFLRRFWIVTALLVPLLFTNSAIIGLVSINPLPYNTWIGLGIATIIFGFSLIFFQHAYHEIQARKYGMMTLVSLAVGAGYLFSVASTFVSAIDVAFYLEISTLIWVLLFGHYLEAKSSSAAGNALQEVAKLLPKKAHKIEGNTQKDVPVTELIEGDIVLIKAGEKIPADGSIREGSANINESLISGESKPIKREKGDEVIAGSICLDGSLTVVITRVGEHSTIGQIKKLVGEAQKTKPRSQRIADKAAGVLTFVAAITALLVVLIWSLVLGQSFVFAITLAITVLVIACPHALGLAIPTVTTITTALAVKNGVFIKDLSKIEVIKKANYVIFDKTGTLTRGEFGVSNVLVMNQKTDRTTILSIAASIEKQSSHVIGQAIVRYSKEQTIPHKEASNVRVLAGKGVQATIQGETYTLGNRTLMNELNLLQKTEKEALQEITGLDETLVFVANNQSVLGVITLADTIKPESYKTIQNLHTLGIKVAMLTGDNEAVAQKIAKELDIDTHFAEVLPEQKYVHIKNLQDKGNVVLMVGDGINDAPALIQADVGIAIGAGTDVAVESADIVLTKNNPQDIVRLLILSRKVYAKMIQNLVWALGYNVIAIPAAAGVFAAWGFFLRPEIGALLMSLSTVIVVVNALTLRKAHLETT